MDIFGLHFTAGTATIFSHYGFYLLNKSVLMNLVTFFLSNGNPLTKIPMFLSEEKALPAVPHLRTQTNPKSKPAWTKGKINLNNQWNNKENRSHRIQGTV